MHLDSFAFYVSLLRKHFVSYCSERFAELGITYSQMFILIFIGKRQECSPKEVSEFLKLDAGQLNRTLSKLMEGGLILQRKNDKDRRANILCLTDKGKDIVTTIHNLFYEWDQIALSQFDTDNRQEMMGFLKQIIFNLNHKTGGNEYV